MFQLNTYTNTHSHMQPQKLFIPKINSFFQIITFFPNASGIKWSNGELSSESKRYPYNTIQHINTSYNHFVFKNIFFHFPHFFCVPKTILLFNVRMMRSASLSPCPPKVASFNQCLMPQITTDSPEY